MMTVDLQNFVKGKKIKRTMAKKETSLYLKLRFNEAIQMTENQYDFIYLMNWMYKFEKVTKNTSVASTRQSYAHL